MPGSKKGALLRFRLGNRAADIVIGLAAAASFYPLSLVLWFGPGGFISECGAGLQYPDETGFEYAVIFLTRLVGLLVSTYVASTLLRSTRLERQVAGSQAEGRSHLEIATFCAISTWSQSFLSSGEFPIFPMGCSGSQIHDHAGLRKIFGGVNAAAQIASFYATFRGLQQLALHRVTALQEEMRRPIGAATAKRLLRWEDYASIGSIAAMILGYVCMRAFGVETTGNGLEWRFAWEGKLFYVTVTLFAFIEVFKVSFFIAFSVTIAFAFLAPMRILYRRVNQVEEAKKAFRTACLQLLFLTLSFLSWFGILFGLCLALRATITNRVNFHTFMTYQAVPQVFDCLVASAALYLLSGVAGMPLKAAQQHDERTALQQRQHRRSQMLKEWTENGNQGWQTSVENLAERGITLRSLLDFYRFDLKALMPDFDPKTHTTNDVVRRAIIPGSKYLAQQAFDRAPYSSRMNGGQKHRPNKMVTHNWKNRFQNLIAAVIADAMDECGYELVAHLMDENFDGLCTMLENEDRAREREGKPKMLDVRYWICAFCVSQHNSICGANPPRPGGEHNDTKTGREHPICDCGLDKYFNDSVPIMIDPGTGTGKSIPCEMNKFGDMISFLAANDSSFEQIIAVDESFDIFSRAWCVKEIEEAHRNGIVQHLKIHSMRALRLHEGHLRKMDVRTMAASRLEDIQEILETIPDVEEFNEYIRHHVVGDSAGLLNCWELEDGQKRMERLGFLARHLALASSAPIFQEP